MAHAENRASEKDRKRDERADECEIQGHPAIH
jgi:hypothetical protein